MTTETATKVTVEPLGALKGAVVRGLDATRLTAEQKEFLRQQWYKHGILILKNQTLDEEQQKAFAENYVGLPY